MVGIVGGGKTFELVVLRPVEVSAVHDDTADACCVTVHIFGGGMGHDVRAEGKRTAVDGCREGVVNDQRNAMRMGGFGKLLDVKNVERRIGKRLAENRFGVFLESGVQLRLGAVGRNEGEVDSELAQRHVEKVEGTAVNSGRTDNVITGRADIENSEEIGGLSRRSENGTDTTLKVGNFCGNRVVGRVLKPGIEIALRFKVKKLSHFNT